MKEIYEKVYIKSEADLPKEDGTYLTNEIDHGLGLTWWDTTQKQFWADIDWYLRPVQSVEGSAEEMLIKFQEYTLEHGLINANFAHAYIANRFISEHPEFAQSKQPPQKSAEEMQPKTRKTAEEILNDCDFDNRNIVINSREYRNMIIEAMEEYAQSKQAVQSVEGSAEEILKYYRCKLHILNGWSIIFGDYRGMKNKVWYDRKIKNATICPFTSTGGIDQYIFHELLHVCSAELKTGSIREQKEKWEIFIQDLCRIKDEYAQSKQTAMPKAKVYYCTICKTNVVDAENGYDTCQECLSKM